MVSELQVQLGADSVLPPENGFKNQHKPTIDEAQLRAFKVVVDARAQVPMDASVSRLSSSADKAGNKAGGRRGTKKGTDSLMESQHSLAMLASIASRELMAETSNQPAGAHLGRVLQGSCPFVQGTQEPQTPTKRLTEFQQNVHAARREKGPQVAAFALAPASRPSSQSVSPHPSPVPVATGRCVCNGVDRGRRSTPKKLTGYDSPRAKTSPPEHGHFCRDSHTRNSSAAVSRFAQQRSRKTSRTSGSFASGIPVRLRLHACIPLSRGYDRIHGSEESACCANARANTLAGGKGPLRPHQGQAGIGGIEVDVF